MRRTAPILFFGSSNFGAGGTSSSGSTGGGASDLSSFFGGKSKGGPGGLPNSAGETNPLAQMMSAMMSGLPKDLRQQRQVTGGAGGANPLANMFKDMMEVREWECWCGHKFRAPGQWIPCGPMMCQAPGCPNPKFFISGEGRKMLDSGRSGPLPSKSISDK
jgi:hypothetical protein